jgi:hypothetical protein
MGEAERRSSPRQKSFLRGIIYYNNRSAAADCLVRDISETGARLELSESVIIPYEIDLHIPKKGETFRARVQWRHGDGVGIAFANPVAKQAGAEAPEAAATPEPGHNTVALAARVQRLEAEVVSLKRAVKQLLDLEKASPRLPI